MPHLTIPLSPDGCALDVLVGVSDARQIALMTAQLPVPEMVSVKMIFDTGASATVIDESVVRALGLSPTGISQILTPSTKGTPVNCPTFDVRIGVYHQKYPLIIGIVPVIGTDFTGQNIQGLIGRDVLEQCLLIYDGDGGTFTLAF